MTQVKDRLLWREKAALALMKLGGGGPPTKHFRRSDIPKIRKMAWQGHTREQIIKALNIDMELNCFSKRCKELQIKLSNPGRPHK